jgi:hypothetical protein
MNLNIMIFDPSYWIFSIGLSFNRYEESDGTNEWVRREIDLGLLILSVRIDWILKFKPVDA